MARIRSIKPEFWSDEKIATLSHGCMAFFIGLWNFCDDEGKCENNPRQLSLRMPVFRSKDILTWLRTLSQVGLTQFSDCSQWVLVTNWEHQKIDRPLLPKVKRDQIQWVTISNSTSAREQSSSVRRKDRIGSDRIGSGSDIVAAPQAAPPPVNKELNRKIWESYSTAYFNRYQTEPVRNAKVNKQISELGKRLGEEAPDVVQFYVSHDRSYYVQKCHEVGLCLVDCEGLRTQWAKGKAITNADIKRFEKVSESAVLDKLISEGKI